MQLQNMQNHILLKSKIPLVPTTSDNTAFLLYLPFVLFFPCGWQYAPQPIVEGSTSLLQQNTPSTDRPEGLRPPHHLTLHLLCLTFHRTRHLLLQHPQFLCPSMFDSSCTHHPKQTSSLLRVSVPLVSISGFEPRSTTRHPPPLHQVPITLIPQKKRRLPSPRQPSPIHPPHHLILISCLLCCFATNQTRPTIAPALLSFPQKPVATFAAEENGLPPD